ncbi:MAG: PqqD family protein [Thermoleophilia bacterium]
MIKLNNDVRKCLIDGEMVLLDSRGGSYFGLNEVGTRMLELALQARNREEAVDILLDEFEVDEATALKDWDDLFAALTSKGLIIADES